MKIPGELRLLNQRIHAFSKAAEVPINESATLAAFYYLQSATAITPQAQKKREIKQSRGMKSNVFNIVVYRKGGNGEKVRRPYFTETKAKKYSRLDSWGMGKAGWWLASSKLPQTRFPIIKPFKKPCGKVVKTHAADLSFLNSGARFVEVTNNAPRIKKMFDAGLDALALGKASNRLNSSMQTELKKHNKTIS